MQYEQDVSNLLSILQNSANKNGKVFKNILLPLRFKLVSY